MKLQPTGCPTHATSPYRQAWLVDTTLRDGAQAPGVVFTPHQRCEIATALATSGIDEIEVGCPAMGDAEQQAIRRIASQQLGLRLTAWCRATAADVEAAARCELPAIHLAVPTSTILLGALNKHWSAMVDTLAGLVARARQHCDYVSVGAMDATRTAPERVQQLARLCQQLGVDRLRLADTVGILNPADTVSLVASAIAAAPNIEIGIHTHNDLGMAVANALVALTAGAVSADVTVLGLGERAGNVPLEELVMALETTTKIKIGCRIDPRQLVALCQLVAQAAGRSIPPQKPIVGHNVFRHQSGIHVRGMLRDPRSFEPFAPAAVGRQTRRLELGTHSGRAGLVSALASEGIQPQASVVERLLPRIRAAAAQLRKPVSSPQAAAYYRQLAGTDANVTEPAVHVPAPCQESDPCLVTPGPRVDRGTPREVLHFARQIRAAGLCAARAFVQKTGWLVGTAALLASLGCGVEQPSVPVEVHVFVAASTAAVVEPLVATYQAQPPVIIRCNAAASSTLARQIEQSAPADIFLSANQEWMDYLARARAIRPDSRVGFLSNRLVLVAPRSQADDVAAVTGPANILTGFAGRIAIGDPDHVPVGMYARAALRSLHLWDAIQPQVVPTKDARSALLLVERSEVDLGLVYATDAACSDAVVVLATFPEKSHPPIRYPLALTSRACPEARAVYAWLLQAENTYAFQRAGFLVAGDSHRVP